jgi:Flp pilus assembly protein TadG
MIEFALVLPILLVLLIGIIEAGAILYDKAVITNAAREGARSGVLRREVNLGETELTKLVQDVVTGYTSKKLISFVSGSSATPTVTIETQKFEDRARGLLSVSVSYTYTGFLLGPLLSTFSEPITLSSNAVMRYE